MESFISSRPRLMTFTYSNLKKISSLVSQVFFSTIFSFLKLIFSFWQIARLQKFFSLHIVEDYYMMPSMDG
jgi:hypothetical protein